MRAIPDEVYREAGDVLRSVSGRGPAPDVEAMPRFGMMVAGAALALERGAPHALYDASSTTAEEWVQEGSAPWRMMHAATARAIDMHRTREADFEAPEDVMTHIVANVVNQAAARRMTQAIENPDPAFRAGLDDRQLGTVDYARTDADVARDIRRESIGDYAALPRYAQDELASDFATGARLTPELRAGISTAYDVVYRDVAELGQRNRAVDERLADFADFSRPLFADRTEAAARRVDQLQSGARPVGPVEAGVVAHAMVASRSVLDTVSREAQIQAMVDLEGRAVTPTEAAVRIETTAVAVRHARTMAFEEYLSPEGAPAHAVDIADARSFARMDPEVQVGLFQRISHGDGVPELTALRLGVAANQAAAGELVAERCFQREIVPVGLSKAEMETWDLSAVHLPGDKVRIDPARSVSGVDREELAARLGTEPLEVSHTFARAATRPNGMGGEVKVLVPEYRFTGHDGHFPAGQFVHERGEEHVYGMVAVEKGRMFLVPLEDKDAGTEAARATGPAREIVATTISDDKVANAENLATMRHEMAQKPMSGEFVFRPEAYGRTEGPVELVAVPWMSGVYASEMEVGMKAIREEIAKGGAAHARGMEFEGMTAEEGARFNLSDVHLPGDRVRAKGAYAYSRDLIAEVGEGPLEVARTVVVANKAREGAMPTATPMYEFEGREGRFAAARFEHEYGQPHVYGVMMEVEGRLWLTPMAEDGTPRAQGSAREVTSFLADGRDREQEANMAHLREEAKVAPIAGEFVYRNEAHGRDHGPVQLVATPWTSGASPEEVAVAGRMISAEMGSSVARLAALAQGAGVGR